MHDSTEIQRKPGNVLLVEDDPADVGRIREAFGKYRILNELTVVNDGREAVDLLLGTGPASGGAIDGSLPDLILLGLKPGRKDGPEALRRIRSDDRTCHIPILLLTERPDGEDAAPGGTTGANGEIRKPVDFGRLVEAVRRTGLRWLLLNDAPASPEVSGRAGHQPGREEIAE
jgi:two-component system, response regulator